MWNWAWSIISNWNWNLSKNKSDDTFYKFFMQSNWCPDVPAQQELFLSSSFVDLDKYLNRLSTDIKTLDLNSVGYIGIRDCNLIDEIVYRFPKLQFLNLECIFNFRNKSVSKFRITDRDLHSLSALPLLAINICGSIAVTDSGIRRLKSLIGIRLDNRSKLKGTFIDYLPNLQYIHDKSGKAEFLKSVNFQDKCKNRGIKIISGGTV